MANPNYITPDPANGTEQIFTNIDTVSKQSNSPLSSSILEYPSQIVRIEGKINQDKLSCEEAHAEIRQFFSSKIPPSLFYYSIYQFCGYDTNTGYADNILINSYFSPKNEQAINYLEQYKEQTKGKDLLGVPFEIESAQGLVAVLNIAAGIEQNRDSSVITRLRQDRKSHYFNNILAEHTQLDVDIKRHFFSSEPGQILPFIQRWFQKTSNRIYTPVLVQANYVELEPELIFFMDKAPRIFTSRLRMYYAHHCEQSCLE